MTNKCWHEVFKKFRLSLWRLLSHQWIVLSNVFMFDSSWNIFDRNYLQSSQDRQESQWRNMKTDYFFWDFNVVLSHMILLFVANNFQWFSLCLILLYLKLIGSFTGVTRKTCWRRNARSFLSSLPRTFIQTYSNF